jgi:NTE family protein
MKSKHPLPISLALQGGGSHSAFSWGVIDQLLLDGRVQIEAISATSGGAMLAAVLAQGMSDGGRDGGRDALLQFWRKVNLATEMLPMRMNVVDTMLSHVGIDLSPSTIALDYISRMFSPYQFNLFDINPLRGIVEEMVDFKTINRQSPLALFINATHAKTGKSRVFTHKELSLDVVMAASCLPFIFKAADIDGEPYWDGSFSGCPPLAPLIGNDCPRDIVLAIVHPGATEDVPTTATDILDRAMEIGFNALLTQELKNLELHNALLAKTQPDQKPVIVHRIDAQDMLASLGRASKLKADWDFIIYLHDLGVQAATDWLESLKLKATHAA